MTEEYGDDIIARPDTPLADTSDRRVRTQFMYPATWESRLPRARRPGLFWRSGVVLNCGKDAPAILDEDRQLSDRALVHELERAFETPLVELGWIY